MCSMQVGMNKKQVLSAHRPILYICDTDDAETSCSKATGQEGESNLSRVNNLVKDQAKEDMGLDHHILCCIHLSNHLQSACIRLCRLCNSVALHGATWSRKMHAFLKLAECASWACALRLCMQRGRGTGRAPESMLLKLWLESRSSGPRILGTGPHWWRVGGAELSGPQVTWLGPHQLAGQVPWRVPGP